MSSRKDNRKSRDELKELKQQPKMVMYPYALIVTRLQCHYRSEVIAKLIVAVLTSKQKQIYLDNSTNLDTSNITVFELNLEQAGIKNQLYVQTMQMKSASSIEPFKIAL